MLFGKYAATKGEAKYPTLFESRVLHVCPVIHAPAGINVFDLCGRNRNGTLTNMDPPTDWIRGRYGYAIDFDGGDDRLRFSFPMIGGTGDFTVVAWIYPTSFSKAGTVGGNYGLGDLTGIYCGFQQTTGRISLYINSGSTFISTVASTLNAWNFVVWTRKNGVAEMFVNGESSGTRTMSGSIGSSLFWAIGRGPDYSGEEFAGQIAEQIVYSRALTAGERKLLSVRPGIALTAKRSFLGGSTFNRRRRLLVGAGS